MPKAIPDSVVKQLVENEDYKLLNIFTKAKKKWIKISCPNNHTYDKRLDGFKSGQRCMECQKLSQLEVKNRIEKEGYKLVSNYQNYHGKLKLICPVGHEIEMQLANFDQGKRCKMCANNQTHTYEYVKSKIESEQGYKLLSNEYINEASKLEIQCLNNHIYSAPYGSFRVGHRCPSCQVSLGENKIEEVLNSFKMKYIQQHTFEDCIYKKNLYFDFYIPNINTCIEYDGRQHFEIVNFGGIKCIEDLEYEFNEFQTRDSVKSEYCKHNNIKLIRIPYWDFNKIENILRKELNV